MLWCCPHQDKTPARYQPRPAAALICAIVASTSLVRVLVMVCTEIGASPPTGTAPTIIWRQQRRSIVDKTGRRLTKHHPNCAPDGALLITALPYASGALRAVSFPHRLIYPVRGKSASNYGNFLVQNPDIGYLAKESSPMRQIDAGPHNEIM